MPGRRLNLDSIGDSYEDFAESVLGRVATLTRISTKRDFGTDTYCQPRVPAGARMETVTELCLLQVKGGNAPLGYGGLDRKRSWKNYEFDWLKNLWAPLYLAVVDVNYQSVDLFSLWPVWWVMWQCGTPFKIVLSRKEPTNAAYSLSEPRSEITSEGGELGDGRTWEIDLGPPLLHLTHENLNDEIFKNRAIEIFRHWIQADRKTVARAHMGIPFVEAVHTWVTNETPTTSQELLCMHKKPGVRIEELARAIAPGILALGAHLQHQGNRDAFRLISILEWLESNGYGTLLTPQLLKNLSLARSENVSPNTYL